MDPIGNRIHEKMGKRNLSNILSVYSFKRGDTNSNMEIAISNIVKKAKEVKSSLHFIVHPVIAQVYPGKNHLYSSK